MELNQTIAEVETAKARAVLPASVPRGTAVLQAGRLGVLVLALERGDSDALRHCLQDAIAEPARAPLYPGYPEARAAALEAGALGVVVSGAGPTVVALAPRMNARPVAHALEAGYASLGIGAKSHVSEVDPQGARVIA